MYYVLPNRAEVDNDPRSRLYVAMLALQALVARDPLDFTTLATYADSKLYSEHIDALLPEDTPRHAGSPHFHLVTEVRVQTVLSRLTDTTKHSTPPHLAAANLAKELFDTAAFAAVTGNPAARADNVCAPCSSLHSLVHPSVR